MVLKGCSQVAETCHPFLALELWKQQRWMEAGEIPQCRFSDAEDVLGGGCRPAYLSRKCWGRRTEESEKF